LTEKLQHSTDPSIRHLVRLSARVRPGGAPRLQKLRFRTAGIAGALLTVRCWSVSVGDAKLDGGTNVFWVAALDAPSSLQANGRTTEIEPRADDDPDGRRIAIGDGKAGLDLEPASAPTISRRRGNVRFMWRSDSAGKLTFIDDALCEVLGCETAQLAGRSFDELIDNLPLEPAAPLRLALAKRDTWSRVEVLWPLQGSPQLAPVMLGGLPSFDRNGRFDGYSGFGVIHLDDIVDRPLHVVPDATGDFGASEETNADTSGSSPSVDMDGEGAGSKSGIHEAAGGPQKQTEAEAGAGDCGETRSSNVVSLRAWQSGTRPEKDDDQAEGVEPSQPQDSADATAAQTGAPPPRPEGVEDEARSIHFNVPKADPDGSIELSESERDAFREIARTLGARTRDDAKTRHTAKTPKTKNGEAAAPLQPERGDDTAAFVPADISIMGIAETIAMAAAKNTAAVRPEADAQPHAHPGTAEAPSAAAPAGDATGSSPENGVSATAAALLDSANEDYKRNGHIAALADRIGNCLLVIQDGAATYANQPMMDTLGYQSFEQFQSANGLSRMFRGRDPEALAREVAGGAIPVVARDGDILAMEGKAQAASWNDRPAMLLVLQPSRMLEREAKLRGLELDIRKRESEIRELHSILDTATDGVAVLDEEGRILSLNGSGQALFGYDQNEVVGEKLDVLFARESQAAVKDYFDCLKSNGVRNILNDGREVQGRAGKGGAIPLFVTIGSISAPPEQRFCAVLRDVTQWKKAEKELSESRQEAERTSSLKSEFLAKISHEVRTPLNAILGFAEVIIDERFGPVENERYKDYLKDIHASGTHVLSLINDLLDLSKIEAGKMELEFSSVDVTRIVNECVSIMQSQAIRERVIMRLSLAPRLPNIVADERSLRQIVLNILSNAVKYNEAGGQIIVSTALTDSGSAVIRIRDTGIGMGDKEINMALEPFRQISTSRQSGGTGLGLPLTKALVEANRASFAIRSKKGEGTLVEVTFPQTRVLAE